jgi:hypothetical protein
MISTFIWNLETNPLCLEFEHDSVPSQETLDKNLEQIFNLIR